MLTRSEPLCVSVSVSVSVNVHEVALKTTFPNDFFSRALDDSHTTTLDGIFTDCALLFCFLALLGSVVFSRGSKKVLFGRNVQEQ